MTSVSLITPGNSCTTKLCNVLLVQNGVEAEDDEQQVFERMQHAQLTAMDPDSSAFFAARKQVRRKQAAQLQKTLQPTRKI